MVESGAWPTTTPAAVDHDDAVAAANYAAADHAALAAEVARLTAGLAAEVRLREAAERNADDLRAAMRALIEDGPAVPNGNV